MCVICIVHRVCGLWNRVDSHLNTGKSCPIATEVIIHHIIYIYIYITRVHVQLTVNRETLSLHLNTWKSCSIATEVIIHMIWYDVIWCDVMWCDVMRWDGMGYDLIRYGLIWFDLIWFDSIWFDLIWLIWFDLIWFDLIQYISQELEYRIYCKVGDISLHLNTGKCCPISTEGSVFYICIYTSQQRVYIYCKLEDISVCLFF